MAQIAELFGIGVADQKPGDAEEFKRRYCPFTDAECDVTANRADRAFLDLQGANVTPEERDLIRSRYGEEPIPLGICSLMTQRQNELVAKPWIMCPKRVLSLRDPEPRIPPELRNLIPIPKGTTVRCWWEVKFRNGDPDSSGFFEYTFDYLLVPFKDGKPSGPPYVIEIMTSSTRGGGQVEHMVDVLALRPQRRLRGVVDSPYTPNYRQVFGRMISQFFAKSEIAEAWGGRALWLVQDVLVDYIEQTTDFRAKEFSSDEGNIFMLVYRMDGWSKGFRLEFDRLLRGFSRTRGGSPDFTRMLGLGFAPSVEALYDVLMRGAARKTPTSNWNEFTW